MWVMGGVSDVGYGGVSEVGYGRGSQMWVMGGGLRCGLWGGSQMWAMGTRCPPGAEVRVVDVGRLAGGVLHTKLWVVDGAHLYIGSANMDWRSLTQVGAHKKPQIRPNKTALRPCGHSGGWRCVLWGGEGDGDPKGLGWGCVGPSGGR